MSVCVRTLTCACTYASACACGGQKSMLNVFYHFFILIYFLKIYFCLSYVYVGKHTREWRCLWGPEMSYPLELEPPSVRWALWTEISSLEDLQALLTIGPSLQPHLMVWGTESFHWIWSSLIRKLTSKLCGSACLPFLVLGLQCVLPCWLLCWGWGVWIQVCMRAELFLQPHVFILKSRIIVITLR